MKLSKLLLSLGIHGTLKGFRYIKYGLNLCLENEDYLISIYKALYPDIAKHFGTTPERVEHCIRTAVSNCWHKGNKELLFEIAGYELPQKPTNGKFFDILYHYLMSQEN